MSRANCGVVVDRDAQRPLAIERRCVAALLAARRDRTFWVISCIIVLPTRVRQDDFAAARTAISADYFPLRDRGRTWHEAKRPPAFREGTGRIVDHTFWLAPGHASEPSVWYAGTSPQGLFRSSDGGATWRRCRRIQRTPDAQGVVRRRPGWHARRPEVAFDLIDPRDETYVYRDVERRRVRVDRRGRRLAAAQRRGQSRFLPEPTPHSATIRIACGSIPRCPIGYTSRTTAAFIGSTAPRSVGEDIGASMPKSVGSISASDGGASTRSRHLVGLSHGWRHVSGHGFPAASRRCIARSTAADLATPGQAVAEDPGVAHREVAGHEADMIPLGVYFGTTSGEIWGSRDEGRRGNASPRTCRMFMPSRLHEAAVVSENRCSRETLIARARSHPRAASRLSRRMLPSSTPTGLRWTIWSETSTAGFPDCAFGSSTSSSAAGGTSNFSLTGSRQASWIGA